jgi:NADPH:quinone reductase-like Zn-dependent oxidoreductase
MDFQVERADIHESRVVDEDPPELAPGQALLRVDRFALTTNNITYAVMGDALKYWDFFPSSDPEVWGRIPVWGFADVIDSADDDVAPGARVYGYLPTSTHLVVTPGRVDPRGFVDTAPHRASLPGAYNGYRRVDTDTAEDPAYEYHRMVLWPLFFTSFLIDDFLNDNAFFSAEAVVVSSASSKTAIGTAFLLHHRPAIEVIGLTSERNVAFVEGLGVYDRVVPYDDIDELGKERAAFVDIAGNADVRAAVHHVYGDRLAHSMLVGATHWDLPRAPVAELPGPAPSFFFAPDQIGKRTKEWGRAGLDDRATDAWRHFAEFSDGWIEIRHGSGPDAVQSAYLELVEGRSDPAVGYVLSLWPERE